MNLSPEGAEVLRVLYPAKFAKFQEHIAANLPALQEKCSRIAEGTTVGHRRIERIAPATTTRLRLSLVSRRGPPRLSRLSLHHT
jgi:hypothetical protein